MFDTGEHKDVEHRPTTETLIQQEWRRREGDRVREALLEHLQTDKPSVDDVATLAATLDRYLDECVPVPSYQPALDWEQQPVISVRVNDVLRCVGPLAMGLVRGDDWQLFMEDWMSGEPGLIPSEVRVFAQSAYDLPTDESQAIVAAARIFNDMIVDTLVPRILDLQPSADSSGNN